jgi:hypothetical protein
MIKYTFNKIQKYIINLKLLSADNKGNNNIIITIIHFKICYQRLDNLCDKSKTDSWTNTTDRLVVKEKWF